jgi:hypothetical protein
MQDSGSASRTKAPIDPSPGIAAYPVGAQRTACDCEAAAGYGEAEMKTTATSALAVPAVTYHVANWIARELVTYRATKTAACEVHINLYNSSNADTKLSVVNLPPTTTL